MTNGLTTDRIRAALRATEAELESTLLDIERNDMDTAAVIDRLRDMENNFRRLRLAA